MTAGYDFVEDEDEQRKLFRRFAEDNELGYYNSDFNVANGRFSSNALENMFIGWCMSAKHMAQGTKGNIIGYVKTKTDENGTPICTSFSAVPLDGHRAVRA